MGTERILIVDDDVLLGQSLKKLLNMKGFEAEYVENPLDVITLLKRKQFDIALIDIYMPHITGVDLAKRIMRRHPSVITIIMTGAGGVEDYIESQSAGVWEFINKPFETGALIRIIREIKKAMTEGPLKIEKATTRAGQFRLSIYLWAMAVTWTIIAAGLLINGIGHIRQHSREMALTEARANFNKDQAFRYWIAGHGGVYVPVTGKTPPNPYLSHIRERDIKTPLGRQLTLINPAYMIRQLYDHFGEQFGIKGHLTSLKLLNPKNSADDWERGALEKFEQGVAEALGNDIHELIVPERYREKAFVRSV